MAKPILDADLADYLPVGPHPIMEQALFKQPQLPVLLIKSAFLLGVHGHWQNYLSQFGGPS